MDFIRITKRAPEYMVCIRILKISKNKIATLESGDFKNDLNYGIAYVLSVILPAGEDLTGIYCR